MISRKTTDETSITVRSMGTVKRFNDSKSFGFIRPDGDQKNCFIHHSANRAEGSKSLVGGDRVGFDVVWEQKDPAAENDTKIAQ